MTSRRFGPRTFSGRRGRRKPRRRADHDGMFLPPVGPVEDDDRRLPAATGVTEDQSRSLSDVVFGFFKKRKERPEERGDPAPSDDPVRRILAIPRGAARLDMFAQTLVELMPGTHGHRGVALAFHRELSSMADQAQVPLAVLRPRVEACAQALMEAGEHERAGELLRAIGKRHQAAELFVSAGAVEELEKIHFDLEHEEGGPRLDARLSFERFETLYLVGMRQAALEALRTACRLWADNDIYRQVLDAVSVKVLDQGSCLLTGGGGEIKLHWSWPVVIGRGEDVQVRLASPLLSRQHAEVALVDDTPYARPLEDRVGLAVDGARVSGPAALLPRGELDVGGVVVGYEVGPAAVRFAPAPDEQVVIGRRPTVEVFPQVRITREANRQVVLQPTDAALLNHEPIKQPTLLMAGDKLVVGDATYTVDRLDRR